MGFAVADLQTAVRILFDRGISLERFDGLSHSDEGILVTPSGANVAWVKDPDGNLLSLVQFD